MEICFMAYVPMAMMWLCYFDSLKSIYNLYKKLTKYTKWCIWIRC